MKIIQLDILFLTIASAANTVGVFCNARKLSRLVRALTKRFPHLPPPQFSEIDGAAKKRK